MQEMATRLIRLDQLRPSAANIRRTAASKSQDAELEASIAQHGLLENLVVRDTEDGTARPFHVAAGERRLKALESLAEKGTLAPDVEVPCRGARQGRGRG